MKEIYKLNAHKFILYILYQSCIDRNNNNLLKIYLMIMSTQEYGVDM